LIEARGREHIGQALVPQTTWNDVGRVCLAHPHDGQAMRNYCEFYKYDEVGNFSEFNHYANSGAWIRTYNYIDKSLIETGKYSNRLSSTTVREGKARYTYDDHGNMTRMPHFAKYDVPDQYNMYWDFEDQLQKVDKGGGCKAYYIYDAAGQRVRKVIEQGGEKQKERIYLGGFEVYREYDRNSTSTLERETLHIMDDKLRIMLIETRTLLTTPKPNDPIQLVRYQIGNHLGSASLELDTEAQVISYEEYYAYGSTSYQAVSGNTPGSVEVSSKRYRYTGKERDEETGLYYYGVRYYAPWLGRWTTADPVGLVDGINIFKYSLNNPIKLKDPEGTQTEDINLPKGYTGEWSGNLTPPSHLKIPSAPPQSNAISETLPEHNQKSLLEKFVNAINSIPGKVSKELDKLVPKIGPEPEEKLNPPQFVVEIIREEWEESQNATLGPERHMIETPKIPLPGNETMSSIGNALADARAFLSSSFKKPISGAIQSANPKRDIQSAIRGIQSTRSIRGIQSAIQSANPKRDIQSAIRGILSARSIRDIQSAIRGIQSTRSIRGIQSAIQSANPKRDIQSAIRGIQSTRSIRGIQSAFQSANPKRDIQSAIRGLLR
jgi:RHS repeat-associated protein